ncbi:SGNH/GDSL hydrolase family protein [Alteribacillus iranensis]|uniref:Lysophospholipase L1 n=1 Tax=Alteribacillus iranensis TaxID=930128 RepID=A0A1I2BP73_9BACI|nr:SGNH/GDSL hydrolase family protein [Alteribacillus iranensis]SFE57648.1 Lysophospholipase L1 [Alteribacillus iranensis]
MIQKILTLIGVLLFISLLASGGWLVNRVSSPPVDLSSSDSAPPAPEQTETGASYTEIVKQADDITPAAEETDPSLNRDIQTVVASVVENARDLFIQKESLHMVAIGDSLTQGVGDNTDNGGYVGILEEMIESNSAIGSLEIKNHGKRGNRTDQLLQRLEDPDIVRDIENTDLILVTIGANDIMKVAKANFTDLTYDKFQGETDHYQKRLDLVFERLRELNEDAPIYLIGVFNPFNTYFSEIPELDQIVQDWNTIGRDTIESEDNAYFIPIQDLFVGADETYFAEDNFHPNQRGYALIADRVYDYLETELEGNEEGGLPSEERENPHEELAEQD